MFQFKRNLLVASLIVAASLTAVSASADDGCGCSPLLGAYYTAYYPVSYSSFYYTDSWYLGVRPGPIRRLLLGSYRWYWGGLDCCYSPAVWSQISVTSCCDYGTTSGATTLPPPPSLPPSSPQEPTRAVKPQAETPLPPKPMDSLMGPTPAEPAKPAQPKNPLLPEPGSSLQPSLPGFDFLRPSASSAPTQDNSGLLTVWVPYDAKVIINGLETRSIGSKRQFVSYGLKPGFSYTYEVRAQVMRNGKTVEEVHVVKMTAGDRESVAFGFNPKVNEDLAVNP
jgi:uncharacterized protein (TIGR03000 family)